MKSNVKGLLFASQRKYNSWDTFTKKMIKFITFWNFNTVYLLISVKGFRKRFIQKEYSFCCDFYFTK